MRKVLALLAALLAAPACAETTFPPIGFPLTTTFSPTIANTTTHQLSITRDDSNVVGGSWMNSVGPVYIETYTGKTQQNNLLGIQSVVHAQSPVLHSTATDDFPQPMAGNFYAIKEFISGVSEVGKAWGINAGCIDKTLVVNPTKFCVGLEADAYGIGGSGTDIYRQRVALMIGGGTIDGSSDPNVHTSGILLYTNGVMDHAIDFVAGNYGTLITTSQGTVAATNGIDLSAATFSGFAFKTPGWTIDGYGNLAMSNSGPTITMSNAGGGNSIYGSRNGVARWDIYLGDNGTESGSNAGSDLKIFAFSDAGSPISTPITIKRSTGNVTFSGDVIAASFTAGVSAGVSCSGSPTASFASVNGIVTHC